MAANEAVVAERIQGSLVRSIGARCDTKAISPPTYILTVGAFALWLAYGVLKSEWPLIATNAPCLALSTFILTMTLLPGRRRRALAAKLDPGGAREVATGDPEQRR
ncbi:MAG TPA: hypothetical protein VG227_07645 [Caulobacteraceae bacterium]|nr:hypothetical protein [Caulobacteraceae bacterium]